uniref:RING-type E3 ubiquitin transferase n=1 Tax=Anopheles atroparvus TaxID=41427 RepID=A0A182J359_ANOAO
MADEAERKASAAGEPELAVVKLGTLEEPQSPSVHSNASSECRKSSLMVYGDGQFSITLKHYDSIVAEVKCPGCAEPMDGAITMCCTGHSICAACRRKFSVCPLCGDRFSELRNYTLEAIVSKVQFPCKNAARGCTVRLPLQLLRWHRERCSYKPIECFMGKVWDACGWQGCERDWMAHCLAAHGDRVHQEPTVALRWDYGEESGGQRAGAQLVVAYYVIRAHGEAFNLYQVFDPDSLLVLWTVICATKESKVSARYAFELELYSPEDSWKLLVQRFPCHSELDPDFLKDGHCVKIPLSEVLRFMAEDKVLHYRVRILEVGPSRSRSLAKLEATGCTYSCAPDYSCKHIENVNLKGVPEGNIIVRKQPAVDRSGEDGCCQWNSGGEPATVRKSSSEDDDVFLPYIDEAAGAGTSSEHGSPLRHPGSLKMAMSVPMLAHPAVSFPAAPQNDTAVELQPIQQLVRVKLAEREEPVKMQAVYSTTAPRKQLAKANGAIDRAPSTESLAKPPKGTGLSKFYNVTMYKAAKFLDKKSIK